MVVGSRTLERYVCSWKDGRVRGRRQPRPAEQFDGQKKMFDRVNRADVEIWYAHHVVFRTAVQW